MGIRIDPHEPISPPLAAAVDAAIKYGGLVIEFRQFGAVVLLVRPEVLHGAGLLDPRGADVTIEGRTLEGELVRIRLIYTPPTAHIPAYAQLLPSLNPAAN